MTHHHLLALHGAGMNGAVFDGLVPHLAHAGYGAAFTALTLPGHADDVDPALLLPTINDMTLWLQQQVTAHAASNIILIGHSLGAAVVLAAARHPKIAGVVALGAAPTLPVNPQLLTLAQQDSAAAQAMVVKWSCYPAHPQAEAVRDVTARIMARVPDAALAVDLAACAALTPLPPPGKPVLVVSGVHDKMTPAAAGAVLAASCGGGQLVLEAGHMMLLEKAPDTASAIITFAASL